MTDRGTLGDRLIAQEGSSRLDGATQRKDRMREILDQERRFARKVRLAALISWGTAVATLVQTGVLIILSRSNEGLHIPTVILGLIGTFSLILAVITTIAWLFRSRTPTLAAIETRLAALEALLIAKSTDDDRS